MEMFVFRNKPQAFMLARFSVFSTRLAFFLFPPPPDPCSLPFPEFVNPLPSIILADGGF